MSARREREKGFVGRCVHARVRHDEHRGIVGKQYHPQCNSQHLHTRGRRAAEGETWNFFLPLVKVREAAAVGIELWSNIEKFPAPSRPLELIRRIYISDQNLSFRKWSMFSLAAFYDGLSFTQTLRPIEG